MRWLRASTARLAPRGERRPSRFRAQVHKLLDEAWYVMQHEETRLRLRIARHIEFGEELRHAREWVLGSDQRNAELIASTRRRADALVRIAG